MNRMRMASIASAALLLLHNGTPADAAEVQAAREAALRRITEEEERIFDFLMRL